jgi:hypothetical protein
MIGARLGSELIADNYHIGAYAPVSVPGRFGFLQMSIENTRANCRCRSSTSRSVPESVNSAFLIGAFAVEWFFFSWVLAHIVAQKVWC